MRPIDLATEFIIQMLSERLLLFILYYRNLRRETDAWISETHRVERTAIVREDKLHVIYAEEKYVPHWQVKETKICKPIQPICKPKVRIFYFNFRIKITNAI